jgi:mono/diheme cytochrome c family protein
MARDGGIGFRPVLAPDRSRRAPLLALVALVLAGALALGGCGTSDTARGRQLFVTNCGTCHTLAQAGTSATIGPDLDAAFADARASGMDSDTIEGVVKAQVESPRPSVSSRPEVSMPAHIVEGQDLDDVAAYVASVAGVPGAKPPAAPGGPGGQVFANNGCAGCHTLKAANAAGTTGPDLDKVLPGQSAKEISQSITDPGAKVTPGYPANVMPSTFGQTITPQDLKLLVKFLTTSAGQK